MSPNKELNELKTLVAEISNKLNMSPNKELNELKTLVVEISNKFSGVDIK
jgi:hypothetical protein